MTKKSAQISIFIIISSILVIGALILLGLNFNNVKLFNQDKISYKVQQYVESCLELESKEAVNQIGIHGGWLYHPPMTFTDRKKYNIINKQAEGLNFLDKVEIPYWYYFDDTAQEFRLNIPPYETESPYSLKNQVKKYVDSKLENDCIQNFQTFKDRYNIKYNPKDINTSVTFDTNNIYVSLNLPVEINEINTNNTEYIDTFETKNDNNLLVPYLIARDITISEANSSFVEKRIMQFITPYQDTNSRDLLPPFYDFKMKYDFRPWDVSKVEKTVKQIINSNIEHLQFLNSNYKTETLPPELKDSEFAQGVYNVYIKDYISEDSLVKKENPGLFNKFKDYTITPKFEPFFPMYFSLSPSMGNILLMPKPEAILNFIPFFFTEYIATYEMTLPIMFEIKDSTSNEKFVFNLAIEANIAHNTALRENYKLNFNLDDLTTTGQSDKTLICDPPQFISDYVSLKLSDPINYGNRKPDGPKVGIDSAIVSFTCKNLATCYITQTVGNESGPSQVKFELPINCDPGKIEISKFGHKTITINNLNPTLNKPINLGEYEMPSSKKIKLNLNILDKNEGRFTQDKTLGNNETAFVIFENKETPEFVRVAQITKNTQKDTTIELMPGNYSIKGFVSYEKPINIKKEQMCFEGGCSEVPEMNFDSWVKAGIEISDYEITTRDILNKNIITVNMINYGVPTSFNSLTSISETMGQLKELSQNKKPYLD